MDVDEGSDQNYDLDPLDTSTYDFQQCVILTSVISDEPVQPPFKLRNSKMMFGQ